MRATLTVALIVIGGCGSSSTGNPNGVEDVGLDGAKDASPSSDVGDATGTTNPMAAWAASLGESVTLKSVAANRAGQVAVLVSWAKLDGSSASPSEITEGAMIRYSATGTRGENEPVPLSGSEPSWVTLDQGGRAFVVYARSRSAPSFPCASEYCLQLKASGVEIPLAGLAGPFPQHLALAGDDSGGVLLGNRDDGLEELGKGPFLAIHVTKGGVVDWRLPARTSLCEPGATDCAGGAEDITVVAGSATIASFDPLRDGGGGTPPRGFALRRVSLSGSVTWTARGTGELNAYSSLSVVATTAGEAYIAGVFTGTLDLGEGKTADAGAARALFVAAFDAAGKAKWVGSGAMSADGGTTASLARLDDGRLLLGGTLYGKLSLGAELSGGLGALFGAALSADGTPIQATVVAPSLTGLARASGSGLLFAAEASADTTILGVAKPLVAPGSNVHLVQTIFPASK